MAVSTAQVVVNATQTTRAGQFPRGGVLAQLAHYIALYVNLW